MTELFYDLYSEKCEINLDKYDQDTFNKFDSIGFDQCGFDKNESHQNGTLYDAWGYDQFGFNQKCIYQNGNYYDKCDQDYLGYDRIYIQTFLTEFRSFLDINCLLNVYCIVKFNNTLEKYLKVNNIKLIELIKKSIKKSKIIESKYYTTIENIYNIKMKILLNHQTMKKPQ